MGWGAEYIAYGSFCLEGHHVRLSRQDMERGVSSQHHHAVPHDQVSGVTSLTTPLTSSLITDNTSLTARH